MTPAECEIAMAGRVADLAEARETFRQLNAREDWQDDQWRAALNARYEAQAAVNQLIDQWCAALTLETTP